MQSSNPTLWPVQNIVIEGIGSTELSPYDMVLYDAMLNLDTEFIVILLNRGANPDRLIPLVVDRGASMIIEMLLELGVNIKLFRDYVTSKCKPELLPSDLFKCLGSGLRKAIACGNLTSIRLILSQLTEQNEANTMIKDLGLAMAVRNGNTTVISHVMKHGHISPNMGLHYAAQFNNPEVAKMMLSNGADINQVIQLEESRCLTNMVTFLKSLQNC